MNNIPDKHEHLVRYYGYYANRSRGARKLAEQDDHTPANTQRKASWARLIQEVYEVDRPWPRGETLPLTYHPVTDIA